MNITKSIIKDISFTRREMTVHFSDGRKIVTPLAWYPRLLNASPAQRAKWRVLGRDRGIHWPKVDADLSIEGILHGIPSVEYRSDTKSLRTTRVQKTDAEVRI